MLGTKIGKADGLSRRPDWKVGIEKDNKNQTLIIEGLEVDILEKIKIAKKKEQIGSQNSRRDEEGKDKDVERRQIASRERFSIKERKDVCTKE